MGMGSFLMLSLYWLVWLPELPYIMVYVQGYGEHYVQTTSAHVQAPLTKQWFKDETRNFEIVTADKYRALPSESLCH